MTEQIISIVLFVAVVLSMLNGLAAPSFATGNTGDTYVYIPVKDLSNASGYAGALVEKFIDSFSGGTSACGNETLLMETAGSYAEYDIDLDDTATSAVLKVYHKHAEVSVKAAGGSFVTLTAKNGAAVDRSVNLFDLTEANALASNDNRFTVRIGFKDQAVVLNGLAVVAEQPELTDDYYLNLLGESYLQNVVDVSAGATRYFDNYTTPTIHMHTGEYVTFYFDYVDTAQSISYSYEIAGATPLTGEVSTDGTAWKPLSAASGKIEDAISLPSNKAFYLRFTAKSGQTFLKNLTLKPTVSENNDGGKHIYMPLNSLSAASGYGGTGLYENFSDTYLSGTAAVNHTLLLQKTGDYVEYELDLDDSLTSALLKLYITGGKVEVKPEGGAYTTLTAKNGSNFNRNIAIYELSKSNALAGDHNKFTLRISFNGSTVVLQSLLIQEAIPEQKGAYTLNLLGESYLQNIWNISEGASRYFADGKDPTVFLKAGQSVTFAFDFADDVKNLTYSFTHLGQKLTAQISNDGASWSSLPASGQIEDALALNSARSFFIRFTSEVGESFLKELTILPAEPEPDAIEETDYVYVPIRDLSNAYDFAGSGIFENFVDTYTGGEESKVNNKTLLLQKPGDYVEYKFNLTDGQDSALLKIYMTDAVVSVKPEGGEYVTLTARNEQGGRFDRGVAVYDLTTANALAANSRIFTVRIACNGAATAVLNGLLVEAGAPEIPGGQYTLEPLGEGLLRGVWDLSQNTSRYFHESAIPTVYIKNGGYVTFRLNFAPDGAAYLVDYELLGALATAEVSLDGAAWTELTGRRVDKALDMTGTGTYYLRFSATAGESFLLSLNASRETEEPQAETNTNPNAVQDITYAYFLVGTEAEKKYMFGIGEDPIGYFEATHDGTDIDGFEGGYSASLPDNVRLFHGKHVTYEFDLADNLTTAKLKVYGLGDMTFRISTDEGETYELLTTQYAPIDNGRGYYIFQLDETNALKGENNKFRLEISGTFGILMGMMIHTGAPTVSGGTYLEIRNEQGMQYLERSVGLRSYYADQTFATYYLDDKGYVIFRIPFASYVKQAVLAASYSGDLHIDVANSIDGNYTPVFTSALGPGAPYTNTMSLDPFLANGSTLYIKVWSSGAGAFLDSLSISTIPAEAAKGSIRVFSRSEAAYLYHIDNNPQGIGTSKRVTANATKARGIDVGGAVVYKINLPDDASGMDVIVNATGQFELTASIDGKTFVPAMQIGKKTDGIRILDPLPESRDKVVYLKVKNMSSTDVLVLYGLSFTTEGIPSYVRPETSDFDYSKNLPSEFATVQKLEAPTEPDSYYLEQTGGILKTIALIGGTAAGAVAVLALVVILLVIRKKKKANP